MIKLVIDMEGSDFGNKETTKACLEFVKDYKDIKLILVGKTSEFKDEFVNYSDNIEFVDAQEIVPMEVSPLKLLRNTESSMVKGLNKVKQDNLDGFVTAGSSGGFITGSTLILNKMKNIQRAAFCAPFVTKIKDKQTVILDIGASNENTPEELVGFALMGSAYAKTVLNIENPSVYLLSNGSEKGKGLKNIVEAYDLLENEKAINFKGNCEAREALDGTHDVIVTPGFEGNIFLKATEGASKMMNDLIKESFKRSLFSKIGYLFARKSFKVMKDTLNYKKTGGAILLGIKKVCVKAHGNSDSYAFYHAIKVAYLMAKNNIVEKIGEMFDEHDGER